MRTSVLVMAVSLVGACAAAPAARFSADTHPQTGLVRPLALCSPDNPCRHQRGHDVTTASDRPQCAVTVRNRRRVDDGVPYEWRDAQGTPRYACYFVPSGASRISPRPLLIWLHGGEGSAEDVYNHTSLREKAESFDLGGDKRGFVLVAVQGRNIHYPTGHPPGSREGRHHDIYYRDLRAPSTNPDIQFLDHLVDTLVARGIVDPRRIYAMGWSNGGFMAQLYGIARHETATPGGNRIAAAAAFGSADPFNEVVAGQGGQLQLYPKSSVPLFLVMRSCDAACACSPAQHRQFETPPGYTLLPWLTDLEKKVGNRNVEHRIIDDEGRRVSTCDSSRRCLSRLGMIRGIKNHLRWPDGVEDKAGRDWEPEMLRFFRRHPHT